MAEKNFNTRIVHKHDIEANWNKAVNFIPIQGELIVYDIDDNYTYERLKIGDGATPVAELPFVDENISWNSLKDRPFYEIANGTLNWDGNTEGLHSLMGAVYKVSDIVPTPEDFAEGGNVVFSNGEIIEFKYDELEVNESDGKYMILGPESAFMVIPDIEGMETIGYLPGIYFFKGGEEDYPSSLTINGYTGFGTIKLLDSKYLNCDQSLDITSSNPVANKVISEEMAKINTAIEDIQKNAVGKNVEGTNQNIDGTNIIAKPYAEIFNNYTYNQAIGEYSHAEGDSTKAVGDCSHAEGIFTRATGISSHAEGGSTKAEGAYSHAEGQGTRAIGTDAHAEGFNTIANGDGAHAEGYNTIAYGSGAHTEGYNYAYSIKVTGVANSNTYTLSEHTNNQYIRLNARIIYNDVISKIIGYNPETLTITVSPSLSSEDLNEQTVNLRFGAFGTSAHTEGHNTIAGDNQAHAEGYFTTATGHAAHAEGYHTIASKAYQHAQGKYNIDSPDTIAHIVGNGTAVDARSNAHTLDWDGNAWYAGDVYVGSTSGTNKDDGSKKLVTDAEVSTAIESLEQTINNKIDAMTTVIAIDDGEGNIELKPFLTHRDIIANILGGEY